MKPATAMELTLSDVQQQIAQAIEDLLVEQSTSAAIRRAAFEHGGLDADLWRQLGELGMCGIHLPAEYDGLGLGLTELVLAAESTGRHLACAPWWESVALASTALWLASASADDPTQAGAATALLAALARGERIGTMDLELVPAAAVQARPTEQGWQLDGVLPAVPAGAFADVLILSANIVQIDQDVLSDQGLGQAQPERSGMNSQLSGPVLLALDLRQAGVQRQPLPTHDATRSVAKIVLQAATVPAARCLAQGNVVAALMDTTRQIAAIVQAAEQVGVAAQCLDMTVAYLQQRVQFDRPLASFQALKHRCAQMMVAVETARSAVLGAARTVDDQIQPLSQAVQHRATLLPEAAMARCLADDAAMFCAQEAIQLHGGVGFTWEYDPQLYFKRAQAARHALGAPSMWRERVAAALLDQEAA